MKRIAAIMMSILLFAPLDNSYALTDDYLLKDAARHMYTGRIEASAMIENLQFSDIAGHWAGEAIVRGGALNLVKGYGKTYQPDGKVANAEALAFVLRAIGRENEAVALGAAMQAQVPEGSVLRTVWSLGYLKIAGDLGLITPQEYASVITPTGTDGGFHRDAEATRERVADWVVKGLRSADEAAFSRNAAVQKLLTYTDFDSVSAAYADAVDLVTLHGILSGDGNGQFRPKQGMTRAEVAQMLKNMDKHYYSRMGYEKKTGVVGTIADNRYKTTGAEAVWRDIAVRTADGTVDTLQYSRQPENTLDAVVYKNHTVAGLAALAEGDEIEYIVNGGTDQVLYVQVVRSLEKTTINAYLDTVDTAGRMISVRDKSGNRLIYSMAEGLLASENGADYLMTDSGKQRVQALQTGSILSLALTNNIVTKISLIGQPTVINEIRGIVTENKPDFGYITVIDNLGKEQTKYYYESELTVEKQRYYDTDDEIGYIDQIFPHFAYDPRDTDITQIEPGDIVFLRISADDPETIVSVSASANYIMKYGKIKQIANNADYTSLLVAYEDQQTAWFDAADDIFVSRGGKPIGFSDIRTGDWAKFLVNQAMLGPGKVMESVKEIIVEGNGHFISDIVKGELSGMDDIQHRLVVKDAYALTKTGWGGYKTLSDYPLAGGDTEYYYNGQRITLDYARQYLKRGGATVYIALENHYTGERVKKVAFRTERDEALEADTVTHATGNGAFSVLSHPQKISADNGTIVRRHGRLVDARDILGADYAYVVLNGGDTAAVVDIVDAPTASGVQFARGRILRIEEGKNFTVQSMSLLTGNDWTFTPVQRTFSIDHNTLFLNENGVADRNTFIGYTDASVVDTVYNIVADGSRAAVVAASPYCAKSVKGTVYKTESDTVYLKDAYTYDNDAGKWRPVSVRDATLTVAIQTATVSVKNSAVATSASLAIGDQIRVMTNALPERIAPGVQVNGYIIIVEK